MIKLLIFDMDGTIIELKDVHYEALNRALGEIDEEFIIKRHEHEFIYNGLPTKKKLEMLTENKGLCPCDYDDVWKRKQQLTIEVIKDTLKPDENVCETLRKFKNDGFKICVASNSIRETIRVALEKSDLIQYVDEYLSNEDVTNAKPDPEMFIKAMGMFGVKPHETMIFEDSLYGIMAAEASGAHVYQVRGTQDIIYGPIKTRLDL